MSKFILPGFLLILLASLMKPTLSTTDSESQSSVQKKTSSFVAVGKIIQNARVSRGLSSDELAYMLNLSNFEIEKIEANEVVPTVELIGKINAALKTNIYKEK